MSQPQNIKQTQYQNIPQAQPITQTQGLPQAQPITQTQGLPQAQVVKQIKSNNVLKIIFNLSTIRGEIISNMEYSPALSNPQLYMQFPDILFIPTIKLTKKMFADSNLGEDDIKKIFLSVSQFDNFISYINERFEIKPISINKAEKLGIIHSNVSFIMNLFFKKNSHLFINDKQYTINNYTWDNKYELIPVAEKNVPIVKINVDFIVHPGKQLSFIDSTRLNCQQQKNNIIADYHKLVGLKVPTNKKTLNV